MHSTKLEEKKKKREIAEIKREAAAMRAYERRLTWCFRWLVIAILLVALLWGGISFLLRPDEDVVEEIDGVPLYVQMIPYGSPARPGTKREVKYVVIHETANRAKTANAHNHALYLSQVQDSTTSWHYTVDDHEIWQQLPDEEVGWHAGDQETPDGGNMCGIGVELCVNAGGDFKRTMKNGAKLTAYLLLRHDLDLSAVRQHHDFSGKDCPHDIRERGEWEQFLQMVEQEMEQLQR